MRLWRISSERHTHDFTGGYGLLYSGRWNTPSRPVTYCSTVPSLAALEKRVHATDPSLLPLQAAVEYHVPDDVTPREIALDALPTDWGTREVDTQRIGDEWLDAVTEALLVVPSVIVPLANAPDRNVLINHRHPDAVRITVVAVTPFTLDPRLFAQ
jgi:RES domain-containing protein